MQSVCVPVDWDHHWMLQKAPQPEQTKQINIHRRLMTRKWSGWSSPKLTSYVRISSNTWRARWSHWWLMRVVFRFHHHTENLYITWKRNFIQLDSGTTRAKNHNAHKEMDFYFHQLFDIPQGDHGLRADEDQNKKTTFSPHLRRALWFGNREIEGRRSEHGFLRLNWIWPPYLPPKTIEGEKKQEQPSISCTIHTTKFKNETRRKELVVRAKLSERERTGSWRTSLVSSLAGLKGGFWGLSLQSPVFVGLVGVESSGAFIVTLWSFERFFWSEVCTSMAVLRVESAERGNWRQSLTKILGLSRRMTLDLQFYGQVYPFSSKF